MALSYHVTLLRKRVNYHEHGQHMKFSVSIAYSLNEKGGKDQESI